jgi:hypothetical protein
MAAIYSNGGNRWNTLGFNFTSFNFTKRDALSSLYKISMVIPPHPSLDPSVTGPGPHQTLLIRRPFQDPQHVPGGAMQSPSAF